MPFNLDKSNKIVSPKGSSLNVRKGPSTKAAKIVVVRISGVKSAGRTTGDYSKQSDGIWYKLITVDGRPGWVRSDVVKLYTPKSTPAEYEDNAQNVVDKLIKSDLKIYSNLETAAAMLEKAKKDGKPVSKIEKTYKGLLDRLTKRQSKLKDSRLLRWKDKVLQGLSWVKNAFKTYVAATYGMRVGSHNNNYVGAIGSMVIGGAIVGGLLATAYFVFRADYDESTEDLKISRELNALLENAEPEVAARIRQDLESQIDKAARSGFTKGSFKGAFRIIKPLALLTGGYLLVSKFIIPNLSKTKK